MGILPFTSRILVREHRHMSLTGNALLLGRQMMFMTPNEAVGLLKEEGVALRQDAKQESKDLLDRRLSGSIAKRWVSDAGFFSLFSDATFQALDVSDYEGAEIIHDLHKPIPEHLANSVDLIVDGSVLDNMFDPSMGIRNIARMLKPGGRAILQEHSTALAGSYSACSQAWYFDFFAINGFADCKIYTCVFKEDEMFDGPYDLYAAVKPEAATRAFPDPASVAKKEYMTVVVAEKGATSTWDRLPIQVEYRPSDNPYFKAFDDFSASKRPYALPLPATRPGKQDKLAAKGIAKLGTLTGFPGLRFPPPPGPRTFDQWYKWTKEKIYSAMPWLLKFRMSLLRNKS
jgi:hypothetical protein